MLHCYSKSINDIINTQFPLIADVYWKFTFGAIMGIVTMLAAIENIVVIMTHKFSEEGSKRRQISKMAKCDLLIVLSVGPLYTCVLLDERFVGNSICGTTRRYFASVFLGAIIFSTTFLTIKQRSNYLFKLQEYSIGSLMYTLLFVNWFIPVVLLLLAVVDEKSNEKS